MLTVPPPTGRRYELHRESVNRELQETEQGTMEWVNAQKHNVMKAFGLCSTLNRAAVFNSLHPSLPPSATGLGNYMTNYLMLVSQFDTENGDGTFFQNLGNTHYFCMLTTAKNKSTNINCTNCKCCK